MTLERSAGTPSKTSFGPLAYMGSSDFSSVVRYLTLSLASLDASVSRRSICFHALCACDRAAMHTPSTSRHSSVLVWSMIELSRPILRRQYSNSVSGPMSSSSDAPFIIGAPDVSLGASFAAPASFSSFSSPPVSSTQTSAFATHVRSTESMWLTVSTVSAASLNAKGLSGIWSMYFWSGLASSTVASTDAAASLSTAPNLRTLPTKSSVSDLDLSLPHPVGC